MEGKVRREGTGKGRIGDGIGKGRLGEKEMGRKG